MSFCALSAPASGQGLVILFDLESYDVQAHTAFHVTGRVVVTSTGLPVGGVDLSYSVCCLNWAGPSGYFTTTTPEGTFVGAMNAPLEPGNATARVTATDANGTEIAAADLPLRVTPEGIPAIRISVNATYIVATDGVPFNLDGSLVRQPSGAPVTGALIRASIRHENYTPSDPQTIGLGASDATGDFVVQLNTPPCVCNLTLEVDALDRWTGYFSNLVRIPLEVQAGPSPAGFSGAAGGLGSLVLAGALVGAGTAVAIGSYVWMRDRRPPLPPAAPPAPPLTRR